MNKLNKTLSGVALLAAAGASHAVMDVSDASTAIADGVVAAGTIGVAMLALVAGIAIWKKIRGAL